MNDVGAIQSAGGRRTMRSSGRYIHLILFLLLFTLRIPASRAAETTELYQSVELGLKSNPQLRVLDYRRQALTHDLEQSRSGWLPSIDFVVGCGAGRYSDRFTREEGVDPSDTDWNSRELGTLKLTQKIYDGGETGSHVAMGKARLDSAIYQLQTGKQTVVMDAVAAHMNVLRQRELVALSEKNFQAHREIYHCLAERERAGAGSIADVSQARARMARAESILNSARANLIQATANYVRATGAAPGPLAYAGAPENLPQTLEEALRQAERMNPELLALDAEIVEADSRWALARSGYYPKLALELSSSYDNQMEGDPSWANDNSAMLLLRWNLYRGGYDQAGAAAALSRKHQSRSQRDAKRNELRESVSATWANYKAMEAQKQAFRDAVDFSRETYVAYLNQFSVSQRTLLDVLIAENDFFQSAAQLINAYMDETIAAYGLMELMGTLQVPRCSDRCQGADELNRLVQSIEFPSTPQV